MNEYWRRCGLQMGSVQRDGADVTVKEADVEGVRTGAKVGGLASGMGEVDGKTFARRCFKGKKCN